MCSVMNDDVIICACPQGKTLMDDGKTCKGKLLNRPVFHCSIVRIARMCLLLSGSNLRKIVLVYFTKHLMIFENKVSCYTNVQYGWHSEKKSKCISHD